VGNRASGERVYPGHVDAVRAAIARALRRLGWEARPETNGTIAAIWTSPVFRFKDDVSIGAASVESGTRVSVRSASRVGRYDFGQNARHVRDLFAEVDKAL
jgi:uncharacterized protein (DUF1499 family)